MTTADKIIDLLDRHPKGLSDMEIAMHLNLPAASVRRTRSQLETQQRVFFVRMERRASLFNTIVPASLDGYFNADEAQI